MGGSCVVGSALTTQPDTEGEEICDETKTGRFFGRS